MNRIRILQVGDIHYPWAATHQPSADFGGTPDTITNVTSGLTPSGVALNKVAASIRNICDPRPDLVVFVGDFTVKGELTGLERAIDFCIDGLLKPIFGPDEIAARVLFVPGNHDVSRPTAPTSDLYQKFSLYQQVLEARGISQHSTRAFGRASVSIRGRMVSALGINTCIGCGEFRALPKKLSDQMSAMMATYRDATGSPFDDAKLDGLIEQLDIPYLDRHDIDGLDIELSGTNGNAVPVVVGHHNLLLQKETRVLPYGELINSGVLREVLSNKGHPLIYLHGNIHASPVEIVQDPAYPDGGIIAISAPLLTDGLNVIDLYLDDDLEPLGVDVIPWRFSPTLQLSKLRSLRVSLARGENRLASMSDDARRIFQYLVAAGDAAHRHLSQLAMELGYNMDEAARHCDALCWAGLVSVSNSHKSHSKWDVRLAI